MDIETKLKYTKDIQDDIKNILYEESELLEDKKRILIRFINKRIDDPQYFIDEIEDISFSPAVFPFDGNKAEVEAAFREGWETGRRKLIGVIDAIIEDLSGDLSYTKKIDEVDSKKEGNKKVFIIHGHDDSLKHQVARYIEKLGLEPIILHEQLDNGYTVIEKFESQSKEANFAIALFTEDDDLGEKKRARQNVVLEYGYFLGLLGRNHAMVLIKGDVEIPSDLHGLIYTNYKDEWKSKLASSLKSVGYEIDMNKTL